MKRTLTVTFAAAMTAGVLTTGGPAAAAPTAAALTASAATPTVQATAPTAVRVQRAAGERHVSYRQWASPRRLRHGATPGTRVTAEGVRIARPIGRRGYRDPGGGSLVRYEFGRWKSPWVRPGFGLTEAIASWSAATPRGTWIAVHLRGRTPRGRLSSWDSLGNWATHERGFHRMTLGEQGDDVTEVAADTLRTRGGFRLATWQVRVTLYRRAGTTATPRLRAVGAMVSRLPDADAPTTRPTGRPAVDLRVPRRSQMVHRGHYAQWGGGGQAWCSPTSTTMLLRFWDRGPKPRAYSWVPDGHPSPEVDFAARSVYDYGYQGAGNWAFNVAYANRYGMQSFVTRLRSLREAERFVRAGIPLAASVRFGSGELDGAPISATAGHLLVIRGFTADGDVVVNDPAADGPRGVRRTYDRAQFADAWVDGSGGLVYVVRPEGGRLPKRLAEANW